MILKVKVYASSSKNIVVKVSESDYKVYTTKPPLDNKANYEVIKLLKEYFKTDAKIIKGLTSKNKIIKIG